MSVAGTVDCGSDSGGTGADERSGSRFTGIARHCTHLGSHDCCRTGQHHLVLRKGAGSHGVQRSYSKRRLKRQSYPKRRHYQIRQRAPQTDRGRIRLELSTPASDRRTVAQTPGRASGRSKWLHDGNRKNKSKNFQIRKKQKQTNR
jgi:hypothetical protein